MIEKYLIGVLACLVVGFADWYSVGKHYYHINFITKPAVLLAMIIWSLTLSGWQGWLFFFGLALIFSLLGDILLMFPPKYFVWGLLAFLVAHLWYVVAFNPTLPPLQMPMLYAAGFLALVMWIIWSRLRRALSRGGHDRRIRPAIARVGRQRMIRPVTVYMIVIGLMVLSAWSTLLRPEWAPPAAALAAAGATLFAVSDTVLSLNRFDRPIRYAGVIVRVTYHVGQLAILCGALLQYGW